MLLPYASYAFLYAPILYPVRCSFHIFFGCFHMFFGCFQLAAETFSDGGGGSVDTPKLNCLPEAYDIVHKKKYKIKLFSRGLLYTMPPEAYCTQKWDLLLPFCHLLINECGKKRSLRFLREIDSLD